MAGDFKPQIYPVIWWALTYGFAAGVLLFVMNLLAAAINVLWAPVFLIGLVYGGWRNYKKQKKDFYGASGAAAPQQSFTQEFKEAARDITEASQEVFVQEDVPAPEAPAAPEPEQPVVPEQPQPPVPPQETS